MKCPFCANEIKDWAIKCQYCQEFIWDNKNNHPKLHDKNSNNKVLLYTIIWIMFIVIIVLIFLLVKKWDNWGNLSVETANQNIQKTVTQDDVLQFDLDKKCKDEYLKEYIYENEGYNWKIWYSYYADRWMGDHNHSADSYYADVFYSPIEKQCIFAFKREYIACDPIFSLCESDEDLETDDFSELEYHIEEATMMWNENKSYMREHFYYTKWRWTIDDMLWWEKTTKVSNVNWWFYWFMNEQRDLFDKELNRLKGK